jgi:hypothetical protein
MPIIIDYSGEGNALITAWLEVRVLGSRSKGVGYSDAYESRESAGNVLIYHEHFSP